MPPHHDERHGRVSPSVRRRGQILPARSRSRRRIENRGPDDGSDVDRFRRDRPVPGDGGPGPLRPRSSCRRAEAPSTPTSRSSWPSPGWTRGQSATIALAPQGKTAGLGTSRGPRRGGWLDGRRGHCRRCSSHPASMGSRSTASRPASRLTISAGVNDSTMLITQTIEHGPGAGDRRELLLGNAFGFGLVGPDGLPAKDPRGRSGGLNDLRPGGGRSTCRPSCTCTGPAT